jgi:hypothetical protein
MTAAFLTRNARLFQDLSADPRAERTDDKG